MIACVLLVAALAVQPAAGDGGRKDKQARSAGQGAKAAGQAKRGNALANGKSNRGSRGSVAARSAQEPASAPTSGTPPPAAQPAPNPSEAGSPRPAEPAPAQAAPAEQGAPPAPAPAPSEAPAASPVGAATRPDDEDRGAEPASAVGRPPASGSSQGQSSPSGQSAGTPAAAAPASAAPTAPSSVEQGNGRAAQPDPRRAARRRRAASRAGSAPPVAASRTPAPAGLRIFGPAAPASPAAEIPTTPLQPSLRTPATEAITRLRRLPGGTTARLPSAADTIAALRSIPAAGDRQPSVGHVLVSWAKYALAVLGLLVLALGINAIVASSRTRRLERQRERLMEDIGLLQAALLPTVPSRLGELLTTVAYRPADGPAAGGDFYDAFALPDGRVALLLGDVSGHGRQALAKTTLVRFTVRAHLEAGLSPREALAISGRTLDGRLSDDFATVIAAIHDPVEGTLTYASAGHPPPIVVGPSRHRPVTVSSSPPIGVGFSTGQRQTVLPMPEGTSVMIYSDGLLEARVDGVPLGPEKLATWLAELGPGATARALLDRVVTRADRVPDDLAAVLLHAAPGAGAPAARVEQLKLDVLDVDGPDLEGFLAAAGVAQTERIVAGRRVSELLATTSGLVVEVHVGIDPEVTVVPIGEESGRSARPRARTR